MGLKFSDAVRLSWSNIAQHKKRSVGIVLTISLLFGVIMGFNFITSGIEETTISASAGQTGGEVYIEVRYGSSSDDIFDPTYNPEEKPEIDLDAVLNEEADEKIHERVAQYGGEVVGYYWYYQLDYPYRVITRSAVERFIDADLWESVPEGKVPVIMPEGWKPPQNMDNFEERLGDVLYRVGSIPSTEAGKPTTDGFNPLNIILAQLASATNDDFWLVDDGSGEVERFIKEQLEQYLSEDGGWYNTAPVQKKAVVKFDNPYKAMAFANPSEEKFGIKIYTDDFKYNAQDLFGTTLMVVNSFNMQKVLLIAVEILLLIVATLVAVLTFAHLIDQDAATVALYRAMGASTSNIYLIYFLYLIELCLLAVVVAMVIAFVFIGLLAITSIGALAERLQEFYNLKYLPEVTLFRFNGAFWAIIVTIMLVAPLSLLLTMRRFSAKHIAKKLKED